MFCQGTIVDLLKGLRRWDSAKSQHHNFGSGGSGWAPFGRRPHPPFTPWGESLPARHSRALHAIQCRSDMLDLPVRYEKLMADLHQTRVQQIRGRE